MGGKRCCTVGNDSLTCWAKIDLWDIKTFVPHTQIELVLMYFNFKSINLSAVFKHCSDVCSASASIWSQIGTLLFLVKLSKITLQNKMFILVPPLCWGEGRNTFGQNGRKTLHDFAFILLNKRQNAFSKEFSINIKVITNFLKIIFY